MTRSGMIAFVVGALTCQWLAEFPQAAWAGTLLIFLPFLRLRPVRLLFLFGLGFFYAQFRAELILNSALPQDMEGWDIDVHGVIIELPQIKDELTRFVFLVDQVTVEGEPRPLSLKVRLSWYRAPNNLRVGDERCLQVRLKHPRGFSNPGGFDYEGWLFQQGIRATGYVRSASDAYAVVNHPWRFPVDQFRQRVQENLQQLLVNRPQQGIILALAAGIRDGLSQEQWRVLSRTGTNHLMAISGLHIGLVAGLFYWLIFHLWRQFPRLTTRWPAAKAAALGGLAGALFYALLAGFAVPTQRALVMLSVVMLGIVRQYHVAVSQSLLLALLAVVLFDPMSLIAIGFWLSFGAVVVIVFATSGDYQITRPSLWRRWGRIQWIVALGLFPLTLFFFQQTSLVAPLANIVAVPWVGVLVVPPVLLGVVLSFILPALAQWVLLFGDQCVTFLWLILEWFAALEFAVWRQHTPSLSALMLAIVGAVWLLSPRGLGLRWLGVIWFLPLFFWRLPSPAAGEVWITLLDVGQGLSAVIRSQEHTLVYDTGPRMSEDFDTGRAVVHPYLVAQGIKHIDLLVIGHNDNDHRGGAESLLQAIPVRELLTGAGVELPAVYGKRQCQQGDRWAWDGVNIEVLYPKTSGEERGGNDSSCVLKIAVGVNALLLTGDIEKGTERHLVRDQGDRLRAQVLVVPHHGSATSSTRPFLQAVRPKIALFAVGYRNRFGFPRPSVVERYVEEKVNLYDTATHGAITIRMDEHGMIGRPLSHRLAARRYWHETH